LNADTIAHVDGSGGVVDEDTIRGEEVCVGIRFLNVIASLAAQITGHLEVAHHDAFGGNDSSCEGRGFAGALDLVNGPVRIATAWHDGEAEGVILEHVICHFVVEVIIVDLGVVDRDRAGFPNHKVRFRVEREGGVCVGNGSSVCAGGRAGNAEPGFHDCDGFAKSDDDIVGCLG